MLLYYNNITFHKNQKNIFTFIEKLYKIHIEVEYKRKLPKKGAHYTNENTYAYLGISSKNCWWNCKGCK